MNLERISSFPSFNGVQVKVEASWDSTVHDCPQLSRVASAEQRVYLTVRVVVQLSHPANMQLVLRKRICVNVIGRQVGGCRGRISRSLQRGRLPPPHKHMSTNMKVVVVCLYVRVLPRASSRGCPSAAPSPALESPSKSFLTYQG